MSKSSKAINFLLYVFICLALLSQGCSRSKSPSSAAADLHSASDEATQTQWVATWAASPQPQYTPQIVADQTVRQVLHTQLSGNQIRLHISNRYGTKPLLITSASVCLRAQANQCKTGTLHTLTYQGQNKIEVAPSDEITTDAVAFTVPPFADLAVSFYFAGSTALSTVHEFAKQLSYFSEHGDTTHGESWAPSQQTSTWYFVDGVDVLNSDRRAKAIVAFGDSITDGVGTQTEQNGDYPLLLAERFAQAQKEKSVINAGISANRILEPQDWQGAWSESARSRFSHDVLAQPGAQAVLMLEGINDITFEPAATAPEKLATRLINAYVELAGKAHSHGLKFYLATLTPTGGSSVDSANHQATRTLVNNWIRTAKQIDGFFDFDLALRDPQNPLRMQEKFDSSDHLHPNSVGYLQMANTIELKDF